MKILQSDGADLSNWQKDVQEKVVTKWWNLADRLIVKYNDGYLTRVDLPVPIVGKSYGIPDWFSRMIGQTADVHPVWVKPMDDSYPQDSAIVDSNSMPLNYKRANYEHPVPNRFDFETKKWVVDSPHAEEANTSSFSAVWYVTVSALIGAGVGFIIARKQAGFKSKPLLG
jgi:hypothetical protein